MSTRSIIRAASKRRSLLQVRKRRAPVSRGPSCFHAGLKYGARYVALRSLTGLVDRDDPVFPLHAAVLAGESDPGVYRHAYDGPDTIGPLAAFHPVGGNRA